MDGFREGEKVMEERLRPCETVRGSGIKNGRLTYQVFPNGHGIEIIEIKVIQVVWQTVDLYCLSRYQRAQGRGIGLASLPGSGGWGLAVPRLVVISRLAGLLLRVVWKQ
jgi:hypothetical protein